ncbi:MAG: AMP-binding protein, partial [Deltaproteobacteria bacterium]|nr:AMP-binding protein [Deltaproteobacteria bacterium]
GIFSTNCHQCVEVLFAVAKAGGVLVPFNYRLKEEEAKGLLDHSEVTTLFFCERYWDLIQSLRSNLSTVRRFICFERGTKDLPYYEDLISDESIDEPSVEAGDLDTALILYTSGTTGFPKGVMLSHRHIVVRIRTRDMDIFKLSEGEKSLMVVPHYHTAGVQGILKYVNRPMTMVIMRQFETGAFLEAVNKERINVCTLVPTMIKRIIDSPDLNRYDLSSLRQIRYGTAPMSPELLGKAMALFPNASFTQGYGMTEGSATTLSVEDHQLEGPPDEYQKKLKRLRSVGQAIKDMRIKIVDEDDEELPLGEVGKILIKGPALLTGYWKDSEATREAIRDGWLNTGDLGFLDEDGYLFIAGREKDIIIRGGENIAPVEIEAVVESHPKVSEAAVIGVPDPEWGEVVRAVVVTKEGVEITEDEVIAFCDERLASYKRPASVVFTDSIPKNPIGKILKRVLREQFGGEGK